MSPVNRDSRKGGNDHEKGIVRWFNPMIGAGFIRTNDGENVLFLRNAVKEADPLLIRDGMQVSVDILENRDGFTATCVRAVKLPWRPFRSPSSSRERDGCPPSFRFPRE